MQTQSQQGGIGFLGLLTIVFITLKLIGYITWSWWWVLAPFWIPASVLLLIAIIATGAALLVWGMDRKKPGRLDVHRRH